MQAQLLYLDAADQKKDVTIYVNSPGGSVTAGMAVFDTMRHVRPDCSTVCVGLAASMGAFLLAAGHKVNNPWPPLTEPRSPPPPNLGSAHRLVLAVHPLVAMHTASFRLVLYIPPEAAGSEQAGTRTES